MNVDNLLSRLDKVKSTGHNKWTASCPARHDKNPSMTIRLLDDDRILIHDFGGSTPQEILDSIGLTFSDLYPEPLGNHFKREHKPFPAMDVLSCLSNEATLVLITANMTTNGKALDQCDMLRLTQAVSRISTALGVARGY